MMGKGLIRFDMFALARENNPRGYAHNGFRKPKNTKEKTMFSKKDNKGFTLMEMLIVVAIIAILIAIMIPVFNAQLEKSREAADAANIRSAYAEVMVKYLDGGNLTEVSSDAVSLTQQTDGWESGSSYQATFESLGTVTGTPSKGGTCTVSVDTNGKATFKFATGA